MAQSTCSRFGEARKVGVMVLCRNSPVTTDHPVTTVELDDVTTATFGAAAFAAGLEIHTLMDKSEGLEDIFLRMIATDTADATTSASAASAGATR